MKIFTDIWEPSGRKWIEENLGSKWPTLLEQKVHDEWNTRGDWILQCHPIIAYLLFIRQYITGCKPETEVQIRNLIPILARLGNSQELTGALSLLGLIIIETRGWEPDLDFLIIQLEKELPMSGSLEQLLRKFFLARAFVLKGQAELADHHYNELLELKAGKYEAISWVQGFVYLKMGLYLLRGSAHSLEVRWKLSADLWCKQHPDNQLAASLSELINKYNTKNPDLSNLFTYGQYENSRELEVIRRVWEMRNTPSLEAKESALFMSKVYGDPFWIEQVEKEDRVEQRSASFRFTFFESFQGYSAEGTPLFPANFRRKKVKELAALLLLQPRYRMVKEVLLNRLFGEEADDDGRYLHVLMHRLRTLFAQQTELKEGWVFLRDGIVSLNEERIIGVDVQEFLKRASVGHQLWLDERSAAIELYEKAVTMYRPVIAPEFEYENWVGLLRVDLLTQQQRMLVRLRDYARENNRIEQAIYYGEALLRADEWDFTAGKELCADLEIVGDWQRIRILSRRISDQLTQEEEAIPNWLKRYLERRTL